jgi:hypothetical protein
MGNFMVLNLFLALLLNSFNSEELKSRKEEVGDESRLAKSFDRIRSIVRRGRFRRESAGETKLEKLVHEIVLKQKEEKQQLQRKGILTDPLKKQHAQQLSMLPVYSKSYQESLNRPVSACDIQELNTLNIVNTISGSQDTVTEVDMPHESCGGEGGVMSSNNNRRRNNNGILHQMSSGFQSKDEPLELTSDVALDAIELKALSNPVVIMRRDVNKGIPHQQIINSQKRQSCPMPRQQQQHNFNSHAIDTNTNSNSSSCTFSEISKQLNKRLSSNHSINTLSLDQDEFLNHINLKDELLNCDKKELFQFLRDEKLFESFYQAQENSPSIPQELINEMRKSVHIQDEIEMLKSPDPLRRELRDCEKLPSVARMSEIDEATGKPWQCLVSYVDDLTVGGRRNSQGEFEEGPTMAFPSFGQNRPQKVPHDCFPKKCYERCPCWDEWTKTKIGQKWMNFRASVLEFVDTPTFEWVILFLIFASSITLCFEDIHLDKNVRLKRILYWTNLFFCIIFVMEMLLKWVAHGWTQYFTSFWTILDFTIVFVSLLANISGGATIKSNYL